MRKQNRLSLISKSNARVQSVNIQPIPVCHISQWKKTNLWSNLWFYYFIWNDIPWENYDQINLLVRYLFLYIFCIHKYLNKFHEFISHEFSTCWMYFACLICLYLYMSRCTVETNFVEKKIQCIIFIEMFCLNYNCWFFCWQL